MDIVEPLPEPRDATIAALRVFSRKLVRELGFMRTTLAASQLAPSAVHPIIELLIERGLPALIHCGHPIFTLPWSIEELIRRYPDARIILGHMGHGNIIYINAAIDVAARNPNVYLETSGMPMHSKIREAVERVGPDRVLYGSDTPFHHPSVELAKVRVSGLSTDLTDRVLGENSRKLFFGEQVPEAVA